MYKVINKLNTKGIEGYDFEKKYCDPLKQVQEREYAKIKKGTKTRKHVTKRGNYLDDEAKMHKLAPGPGHYICKTEWSEKTKSHVKPVDRRTVFAEIMRKEKR